MIGQLGQTNNYNSYNVRNSPVSKSDSHEARLAVEPVEKKNRKTFQSHNTGFLYKLII